VRKNSQKQNKTFCFNTGTEAVSKRLTADKIRAVFDQSIYREIIEDPSFQRLKRIRFLGAIDYILDSIFPQHDHLDRAFRSRYQHTLGVANLALRFARTAALSERDERIVVLAALLHDIGHGPFSHSIEPVFKKKFNIEHHETGKRIIQGESPLGDGILNIIRSNGLDPDEIIGLISGQHSSWFVHLFASPMNIDTFDGIIRSQWYLRITPKLSPEMLVDSFLTVNSDSQRYFDSFWEAKHTVYQYLINSDYGVMADALARKYLLDNIDDIRLDDYYLCERTFLKRHPVLLALFKRAGKLFSHSSMEEIEYKKRVFSCNIRYNLHRHDDFYLRYSQSKQKAKMAMPATVTDETEIIQSCLFDNSNES
jgi:putative nucleotidyltransferase with HDIG domain